MEDPTSVSLAALNALQLLRGDLHPFAGNPRACDLYAIHGQIAQSIRRACALLADPEWAPALDTLLEVSRGVNVTLRGESGGPLPLDLVVQLAIDLASTPSRRAVVASKFANAFETEQGFCSDIASFRLLAARLALAMDDTAGAESAYESAAAMLVGYGWRKDITVYELLDPLLALSSIDILEARTRLSRIASMTNRVVLHTDGSETAHAPSSWWASLARLDPVAASDAVVHAAAEEIGALPQTVDRALDSLWDRYQTQVPPRVATALRLSLMPGVRAGDISLLRRLGATGGDPDGEIARLILSQLDEAADRRDGALSQDARSRLVARAHQIADDLGLDTAVNLARRESPLAMPPDPSDARVRVERRIVPRFGGSVREFVDALRDVRGGLFEPAEEQAERTRRLTLAAGYRIAELAETDREKDASYLLSVLADHLDFDEVRLVLIPLADGLEQRGFPQLAATALTLAFTRIRHAHGYRAFGGVTDARLLFRAQQIDRQRTTAVLTGEIAWRLRSRNYGVGGLSESLILVLGTALRTTERPTGFLSDASPFATWDSAFEVVDRRLPVGQAPIVYIPTATVATAPELVVAFCKATLAGLLDAGKERKRLALVGLGLLIEEGSAEIWTGMSAALPLLPPLELTWVLSLFREHSVCPPALHQLLVDLSTSDELATRSLAADLMSLEGSTSAPPTGRVRVELTQSDFDPATLRDRRRTILIVRDSVSDRLQQSQGLVPGLPGAMLREVDSLVDSATMEALTEQLRELGDPADSVMPEAVLELDHRIESTLQSLAADVRTSLAFGGVLTPDPSAFERSLCELLRDDPRLALLAERARMPRPLWLRSAEEGTLAGSEWTAWPFDGLGVGSPEAPRLRAGFREPWRLLALEEIVHTGDRYRRDTPPLTVRTGGLVNLLASTGVPPAALEIGRWPSAWEVPGTDPDSKSWRTFASISVAPDGLGSMLQGLRLISPSAWLVAAIGGISVGEDGLVFLDGRGDVSLALRTWREPRRQWGRQRLPARVVGSGLFLRPDLYDALVPQLPGTLMWLGQTFTP